MGIYHKMKKAAKYVGKTALDVTTLSAASELIRATNRPNTVIIQQPAPQTVYVQRQPQTRGVYTTARPAYVAPTPALRIHSSTVTALRVMMAASSDSGFFNGRLKDDLRHFGRGLVNIYYDGYCHDLPSPGRLEAAEIVQMIERCNTIPVRHDHDMYRELAWEFLEKYEDILN